MKSLPMQYFKIIGLLAFLFIIGSCDKIDNTAAIITIVDRNGNLVSGADVHVFPSITQPSDPPAQLDESLDQTKVSDTKGQVFFDYTDYFKRGQVGLFVLDIEVTFQAPDTLVIVPSIIKVVEQETNAKEVELPIDL